VLALVLEGFRSPRGEVAVGDVVELDGREFSYYSRQGRVRPADDPPVRPVGSEVTQSGIPSGEVAGSENQDPRPVRRRNQPAKEA